jgi:hypothetical protein
LECSPRAGLLKAVCGAVAFRSLHGRNRRRCRAGKNVAIEFRCAQGKDERLLELGGSDRRPFAVIATLSSTPRFCSMPPAKRVAGRLD